MIWHKPDWSNKQVELFSNTYFYALEAVIVNIIQTDPTKPVNQQVIFLFNHIIDQGEDFTYKFLSEFKHKFNHERLWLQDLKPQNK